jgi:drug/metabolite transporter (DMT)-like permease
VHLCKSSCNHRDGIPRGAVSCIFGSPVVYGGKLNAIPLALTVTSVFLHAGWNLLGKKQSPSLAFFVFAVGSGGLLFSPVLFWGLPNLWYLPITFWLLLIVSGFFQLIYLGGLAWAYSNGDMSVLYPFVRGLPVALVAVVANAALGGSTLHPGVFIGIVLVVAGTFVLPLNNVRSLRLATYLTPAFGFALLAVAGTVGYSIADKAALDLMRQHGFNALTAGLTYTVIQAYAIVIWAILPLRYIARERRAVETIWATQRQNAVLAGVAMTLTYGLVLIAMATGADVRQIVALRQLSIPVGTLFGIFLLKESVSGPKLFGTAVMLCGLAQIALM